MLGTYRGVNKDVRMAKNVRMAEDRPQLAKTSDGNSADTVLAVRKRLVTKYKGLLSRN
jgi:hypothetical protein